jgi:glycosyltransferase involved in cell wall biosynthesis
MFLCVANYSDRKNQISALHAFRKARIEKSTFVFIGSELNEYSKRLNEHDSRLRASGFDTGNVLILQKVERPMVIAALKGCDVFVLSARTETMPVALLEAMIAGKPFISTNTGCVSELPGGIVVENESALQDSMESLARDARLRETLGERGRTAGRKACSMEKVIDRFEALCEERLLAPIENSA